MNAQDIMMIIDKICEKENQIGIIKIQDGDFKMVFKSNKAVAESAKKIVPVPVAGVTAVPEIQMPVAAPAAKENVLSAAPAEVPAVPVEAAKEEAVTGNEVKSPLVGTFYVAPSEDAAPFVQVGDRVKKGQTLAIVEAMKLMNEIESEFDGVVKAVLVDNATMVEYGQPLFIIG